MGMLRLAASAIGITVLTGCVTSGNPQLRSETNTRIQQQIQQGTTTEFQVRAALGEPQWKTFTADGNEVWTYRYSRSTPRARDFIPIVSLFSRVRDVKSKELVILFQTGVVSKYDLHEAQSVWRAGIAE